MVIRTVQTKTRCASEVFSEVARQGRSLIDCSCVDEAELKSKQEDIFQRIIDAFSLEEEFFYSGEKDVNYIWHCNFALFLCSNKLVFICLDCTCNKLSIDYLIVVIALANYKLGHFYLG